MGILSIYKRSRYTLNPTHLYSTFLSNSKTLLCPTPAVRVSNPKLSAISSTGNPSFPLVFRSIALNPCISSHFSLGSNSYDGYTSDFSIPNVCFLSYNRKFRSFSSSTNNVRASGSGKDPKHFNVGVSSGEISRILDIIKVDAKDMESNLDSIGSNLPRWSVIEILRGLNVAMVPALRFFEWVRDVHPNHSRNADVCSLIVDNCGRLGDYATMLSLLKDFRSNNICLSSNAFGFLPILSSTMEAAERSIRGVIQVLNEVGGSCRNSGIHSLLELLCSLNSFDLARFVMEVTEKRPSYYSVLIKHICIKHEFDSAKNMLEEMWQSRCEPETKAYNYLISSLCKLGRIDQAFPVLQEMLDKGCPPDVVTFEILIYFSCRYGRSENAIKLYNKMILRGIKARLPTHSAFIRGFFNSRQFEEAYRYVVDTAVKDKLSAQETYHVLAGLHLKHGDLLVAHNLLVEMIEKGLKPKHSLYLRVLKRLYKTGKPQFAKNLNDRFSSLMQKIRQSTR